MFKIDDKLTKLELEANNEQLTEKFRKKYEEFTELQTKDPESKKLPELDNVLVKLFDEEHDIKHGPTEEEKQAEVERKALDQRATAVGLQPGASEKDIEAAEEKTKTANAERKALDQRATAVGLQPGASEADITTAEEKAKTANAQQQTQDKINATIATLKSKAIVSFAELEAMGISHDGKTFDYQGVKLVKRWMLESYEVR